MKCLFVRKFSKVCPNSESLINESLCFGFLSPFVPKSPFVDPSGPSLSRALNLHLSDSNLSQDSLRTLLGLS